MIKRWFLFFIIFVPFLAACGEEEPALTPTPFDARETRVPVLARAEPVALALAELMAEPETYENQYVQLTGAYQHRPLLVCNDEVHPSPATWLLFENEEAQVAAGGFNSQLRALISEGTPVTVNGYWRLWDGVVGCGKEAIPQQIWYLIATEMVSPAQLARGGSSGAEAISGGAEEAPLASPVPENGETISETPLPVVEDQPPTAAANTPTALPGTGTVAAVTTTPNPGATAVPTTVETVVVFTQTPTSEARETETPVTATATVSGTAVSGTPTPTAEPQNTPGAGSPTPTQPAVGTETPTSEAGTYTEIVVDSIEPDAGQFGFDSLAAWQKQNWPLTLANSQLITIGVAAEPWNDIVIALFDEAETLVVEQNNAPAGQMEEIPNIVVDPAMSYTIQVYDAQGVAGDYFITIVGDASSLVLSGRGIMNYGDTRLDSLGEDQRHFWYFYGEEDDVINITTTAADDDLLLISLFDYEFDVVEDDDGEFIEYVEEAIEDLRLPVTGLYLIWLEEFAYFATDYTVSLEKQ